MYDNKLVVDRYLGGGTLLGQSKGPELTGTSTFNRGKTKTSINRDLAQELEIREHLPGPKYHRS